MIFLGTALLLLPLHSGDCSTSCTAMGVGSVTAILGGVFALIYRSGGFFTLAVIALLGHQLLAH